MNFTKLFEGTIEEEFDNIMSDSTRSMTRELSPQEWWAQRTRLDERMKVQSARQTLVEKLGKCACFRKLSACFG